MRSTRTWAGAFFFVLLCSSIASFASSFTAACAEYTASITLESMLFNNSSFFCAILCVGSGGAGVRGGVNNGELDRPEKIELKNEDGFAAGNALSTLGFSLPAV